MTRRLPLILFAALFAATPLAAQDTEPPADETTPDEVVSEIGDRVERAEQGLLRGVVVLLDGENLIIETSEGDRAFSIRPDSELPDELRDAEAWATAKGMPVSVAFQPGEEGELRVVERVTLLPPSTVTTTMTASPPVEPTEITVTTTDPASTTTTSSLTAEPATSAEEIAAANPDERDAQVATGAAALTDDDDLPPAVDTVASLPGTASSLPLLALLGSLALLAALALGGLEARRRRVTIARPRR
ncbi:MAG TPA: hypothetical protein VM617_05330 [Thermoanaerobaculia bacterium]|nr:hypothetical protein [Thermoanaerobaculia bacterium]